MSYLSWSTQGTLNKNLFFLCKDYFIFGVMFHNQDLRGLTSCANEQSCNKIPCCHRLSSIHMQSMYPFRQPAICMQSNKLPKWHSLLGVHACIVACQSVFAPAFQMSSNTSIRKIKKNIVFDIHTFALN